VTAGEEPEDLHVGGVELADIRERLEFCWSIVRAKGYCDFATIPDAALTHCLPTDTSDARPLVWHYTWGKGMAAACIKSAWATSSIRSREKLSVVRRSYAGRC
jgi:hypothetical protein